MDTAAQILARLDAMEKRIALLEGAPAPIATSARKKVTINEFIISKRPASNVDRAAVLAYYMEHHEGAESFNTKDIDSAFSRAKEKSPTNTADVISKGVGRGLFFEQPLAKDKLKAYALTNTGRLYVENNLKEAAK